MIVDDIAGLRRILARNRTFAIVGLSANWYRPSYFAAKYMQDHGFRIVPDGPALDGIRAADFVLCLLTKERQLSDGDWTPDPGVIEEKAAALALDKYLVLLVEDGVTGFGTLQGDRRQHRFTPTEFTSAALKAVRELRIAAGRRPE